MKWHWYTARSNELLLDLDSDRALAYAKDRLSRNEAILRTRAIHLYRSGSANHYHMIITLRKPMVTLERTVWELHLGSDLVRQQYNLMRIVRGVCAEGGNPDFLIADRVYPGFRKPNYTCECPGKHKEKEVTDWCPVLLELLGPHASAKYFAIRPKAKLAEGRVPLNQIIKTEKD